MHIVHVAKAVNHQNRALVIALGFSPGKARHLVAIMQRLNPDRQPGTRAMMNHNGLIDRANSVRLIRAPTGLYDRFALCRATRLGDIELRDPV